jgi:NRPS condensation-like uncharacterized protein
MSNNKPKSFSFESFDMLQRLFIDRKYSNSIMRFIIKLNGKIDIEHFKKTVQLSIEAFPLVSCKSYEGIFTSKWNYQDYPLEDFITVVEGKNGEDDETIMEYFFKNIDYDIGPHIRFVVVQCPNRDSILISINHMMCDATSFKDFLYMFCDIYDHPENVDDYSTTDDRSLMQLFKSFSLKENFNIFTSKDKEPIEIVKFDLKGDPNRPFLETRTLTQDDFDKLKAYSKAKSVTLNDIFMTAIMRAFYKFFNKTVVILCDINLRKYLENEQTKGFTNMLTTVDCKIGEELGDTFEETLNKITQCMTKEKENIYCTKGLLVTELIMKFLPYRLGKYLIDRDYKPYPLEVTNLGIIDQSKVHFKNIEVSSVLLTGSTKFAPSFELSVCTFNKILSFCINFYGTESDQKIINDVLDTFIKELTSIF